MLTDKIKIKIQLSKYTFEQLVVVKTLVDNEYKVRKQRLDKLKEKAR